MQQKQHKARKRFGQNFLHDQSIVLGIVNAVGATPADHIVEIGPGQGAITQSLFDAQSQLTLIELDRDLVPQLQQRFGVAERCEIISQDVLQVDFSTIYPEKPLRVVGNLPYNISTPLMFKLMQTSERIQDMHFMLQREVVDRITASPGNKHWGRLSIMMQYYCQAERMFDVAPECFDPAPKVWSSVVRLTPHAKRAPCESVELLEKVVRIAFNMRRKTIRNALKELATPVQLQEAGIDVTQRPENLSLNDYIQLTNLLYKSATPTT